MLSPKLNLDALRVAPTGERLRVLVVDDEPLVRRWVERVLVDAGYDVDTAKDGLAAVSELQRSAYALVLTDVTMPRLDGLGVLVASIARDATTPVVLMTGAPRSELLDRAHTIGAVHLLVKPMPLHEILDTVGSFVRLRGLHALLEQARVVVPPRAAVTPCGGEVEALLAQAHLAYQPIVAAADQRALGVEALLRSSEPSFVEPQGMLMAASAVGSARRVAHWVRDCCKRERARDDGLLFVNVTLEDLDDLLIDEHGFGQKSPRVVLDLQSAPSTVAQRRSIEQLKARGYRFSMLASEAHTVGPRATKPDAIRLDPALVRHIDQAPEQQALCRALLAACAELAIGVIALGVETEDEARVLRELGCTLFQGHLFGHPAANA